MKINSVTKIGLGFTLAIVSLIWGLAFLKGKNVFSSQYYYYAEYPQVDGLVASSPVTMNGLKIGTVSAISFNNDNSGKLTVTMMVENKYQIPFGSVAKISSVDLMGTKAVKILRKPSDAFYADGDTLVGAVESDLAEEISRQMAPLKNKAEKLMGSLDSLLIVFQSIFDPQTTNDIQNSISSLNNAMRAIERGAYRVDTLLIEEKSRLSAITRNVQSITQNLADNNATITRVLSNTAAITDSLAKYDISRIIADAQSSVHSIDELLGKINRGEGTLGALLHNDTLYYNLERASRDLDYLLLDVRNNPKKYVRFSLFDRGDKYVLDSTTMQQQLQLQSQTSQQPK